jgi:hypothetical protein
MIKIIKSSKVFKKKCSKCRCKFSYDMTDTIVKPCGFTKTYTAIECPHCNFENWIKLN